LNDRDTEQPPRPARFLLIGVVVELLLVPLAWLLELLWPPERLALEWSTGALTTGALGAVPPVALLLWLLSPRPREFEFLKRIRSILRDTAGPALSSLKVWHMIPISLAAGIGEEILFRGALQARLGLLLTSVLFGILHPLTLAYTVLAGLLGAYLGWLQMKTGNLLAPITTHMLYDLVALFLVRRDLRAQPAEVPSGDPID